MTSLVRVALEVLLEQLLIDLFADFVLYLLLLLLVSRRFFNVPAEVAALLEDAVQLLFQRVLRLLFEGMDLIEAVGVFHHRLHGA